MHLFLAVTIAACSGFAVMVLEIVGTRLLARDFGSSFYVWTSQIGVVLVALTAGYLTGGWVADRHGRPRLLAWLLLGAGAFTWFVPEIAGAVMEPIVTRHPVDQEIPLIWQKLDPAIGAALIFFPPCFVLAILPPFLIRVSASAVAQVGRVSGSVYGAGSAGSIAGVFTSGYLLIDWLNLTHIFRWTGLLIAGLAMLCWFWKTPQHESAPPSTESSAP